MDDGLLDSVMVRLGDKPLGEAEEAWLLRALGDEEAGCDDATEGAAAPGAATGAALGAATRSKPPPPLTWLR